tara:strand:- start:35 stop:1378 length:1344 start_codon:yes stop_codon:yes gene_type:complete
MKNINELRQIVIKRRINYLNELRKKNIDTSLSSLSSFRTLLFNNFCSSIDAIKKENIKVKISKINFFYQIKNFIYILKFSNINIIGDFSKENLKKYSQIIVVWSKAKDFSKDGKYYNNYFNTSSERKKNLWFLIHLGNEIPKKTKKNIIILTQREMKFGFNIVLLFKYFFKILIKKNFSPDKIYHELSFDSLIANNVKDFFNDILSYYHPKKIIFPYESQPFQNALIEAAKKSKKKITLIGYDHSSNPFPIYNIYNFNSPDLLYVHSDASKFFYSKYFKWPAKKIKKTASFRITKKKPNEFKYKIFLPYDFYSVDEIIKNFELLLDLNQIKEIKKWKVKIHPSRLNSKKHLLLKERIYKTIKTHEGKYTSNSKEKLSIHIGNTSTVIESLEIGVPAIHIVCDPIFDFFSSKFWPTIRVSALSSNIFKYSMKKFGKCLIFKSKTVNFN